MNPLAVLPAELSRRVGANWGEAGRTWLAELPARIERLRDQLGLSELKPEARMGLHWVGHGLQLGMPVTLKLGVADTSFETQTRALARMQSLPGMVRLRESDAQAGWLLMERVEPGVPLSRQDDHQALEIWLAQVGFLAASELDRQRFPDALRWCRELWAQDLPEGLIGHAGRARARCEALAAQEPASQLLHGDLHHDNLIWSQTRGWVAIDPQGVVAGPEFELGAMLRNPFPQWNASPGLEQGLRLRLERIAGDARFRLERVMEWAYVQAVLAACWSRSQSDEVALWLQVAEALERLEA